MERITSAQRDIVRQCIYTAAEHFPAVDWDSLVFFRKDLQGEATGWIEWDEDGDATIIIDSNIRTETDLRELLAHEFAHYVLAETDVSTHNKRPHGPEWFTIYGLLLQKLVWQVYYPEEWEN